MANDEFLVACGAHWPGLGYPGLFPEVGTYRQTGESNGMTVNRLVMLLLFAVPLNAQAAIEPKTAEFCMKAADFAGCEIPWSAVDQWSQRWSHRGTRTLLFGCHQPRICALSSHSPYE
ncbi:hypothetical protein OMCYN_01754 [cyanobiont of Ornithocercus magnificus]|nr:hypothetical protein OMCYN_01754 [cyanobiont of Ornithocercus magnificus]